MTTLEILGMAEKLREEYEYVGIRTHEGDFPFVEGEIFTHCSRDFESRDMFSVGEMDLSEFPELDGASAWDIRGEDASDIIDGANDRVMYDHVAILASDRAYFGDESELIMVDPVVAKVLF